MKTRLARHLLAAGIMLAALVACSQQPQDGQAAAAADSTAPAPANQVAPAPSPASAAASMDAKKTALAIATAVTPVAQLASSATTYSDAQHKFIRTAHAEFRVKDVYTSALAIEDIAAAQGGFVINNDISAQTGNIQTRPRGDGKLIELAEYTLHGNLIVRVPSDHTQAFLRAIAGQIDFLDQRRFEAADAQFDVLRQQLAWQRGQEEQLELGQAAEDGGRLDQKVEAAGARNDVKSARDEALIAQKQFEDRIAYSTIDLSIYQTPRIRATERIDVEAEFQRNSPGFFPRMASSLRTGWAGLLNIVIALAAVWPLWAAMLAIGLLVRITARRRLQG